MKLIVILPICLLAGLMPAGCSDRMFQNALLDPSPAPKSGRAWLAEDTVSVVGSRLPPTVTTVAPGDSTVAPSAPKTVDQLDVRAAEMAQQRVLVYTAEYCISVANPETSLGEVARLADDFAGYIHSRTTDKIVIRVPADKFKPASERIERLGLLVSRSIQAQDVTEDYIDLQMRLATNQAMLKRLQALLDKTQDVKSAVEIEREIGRVMTEIERLQGTIRLLSNRIALSTITIAFTRIADAPRSALLGRRLPVDWLHTLGLSRLLDY